MRLFDSDTCCLVVPLYNAGMYAILVEQAAVAIAVAVLALATPQILAVTIPSFGSYILAALSIVHAIVQLLGLYAVRADAPRILRSYIPASMVTLALSLIIALVWIILSAAKRSDAINVCLSEFGSNSSDSSSEKTCSTFISIQLGVMGLLLFIALVVQSYFAMMTRIYASNLARDHKQYHSVLSLRNNTLSPAQSPTVDTPFTSTPLVGKSQEKSTDHFTPAPSLYPDPYPSDINLYHQPQSHQPHQQPYHDDPVYYPQQQDPYYYTPDHLVQQQPEQHTYYPYEYNQGYYNHHDMRQ